MVRRETWIPLAVVSLTIAFVLVSGLVRLSAGNPWLIRRKLRLGALLLGLGWSAAGCDGNGPGSVTCYAPVLTDEFQVDDSFWTEQGYVLDLSAGHVLTGEILMRTASSYAFEVRAGGETVVLTGELAATDGAFDESREPFQLDLGTEISPESYEVLVYAGTIETGHTIAQLPLTVVTGP